MPDGVTHFRFHKMGWAVILPTSFTLLITGQLQLGAGILAGYGLGAFFDPDLDQVGISASEGRIINKIPIFGYLIVGYTTIYGAIFRRHHRSFWTHFPIVSTTIRLIYFFWWLYFVIPILYDWQIWVGVGVFIGLSFADFIHWVLDIFFPDTGKVSSNSKHIFHRKG